MLHDDVYNCFTLYFPQISKHVIEWFPNGRNSVRVRRCDNQDFIFTYHDKNNWCFETVDSFIERLKGGLK